MTDHIKINTSMRHGVLAAHLFRPYTSHPMQAIALCNLPDNNVTPFVVWTLNPSHISADLNSFYAEHGDYAQDYDEALALYRARIERRDPVFGKHVKKE